MYFLENMEDKHSGLRLASTFLPWAWAHAFFETLQYMDFDISLKFAARVDIMST
jgi:hypothetical protein